jgi:hypothetical protein
MITEYNFTSMTFTLSPLQYIGYKDNDRLWWYKLQQSEQQPSHFTFTIHSKTIDKLPEKKIRKRKEKRVQESSLDAFLS